MPDFIDKARLHVEAGAGGAGSRSMRRELYVERGGPDGGDGGRGGDVILESHSGLRTLREMARLNVVRAGQGTAGGKQRRDGHAGDDKILRVPLGTLVYDEQSGDLLGDLVEEGQRLMVAKGGRGGRGNVHFKTSTKQAPQLSEKGEPGEMRTLLLELKLLADAGLVGKPNAGKSTLLSRVSAAKARAANYAFTTLQPQLGVVDLGDESQFVLADLPGLIEGAAQGKGLGHRFLRHIERTRVLLFLLDAAGTDGSDALADYKVLNKELRLFRRDFDLLPRVVGLNKMDLAEARENAAGLTASFGQMGIQAVAVSAATGEGMDALMAAVYHALQTAPPPPAAERKVGNARKVYRPGARFHLEKDGDTWVLSGAEVVKWMALTDFGNDEALRKLKDILKRLGVSKALKEAGAQEGDPVRVGNQVFEYTPS